jgi:hypothetical protein
VLLLLLLLRVTRTTFCLCHFVSALLIQLLLRLLGYLRLLLLLCCHLAWPCPLLLLLLHLLLFLLLLLLAIVLLLLLCCCSQVHAGHAAICQPAGGPCCTCLQLLSRGCVH